MSDSEDKLKVAHEALRRKMAERGFKESEIDAVISGQPMPSRFAAPVVVDDRPERLEKFVKMQKMNLPQGAIRSKMTIEGFTEAEIDAFLSGQPLPPKT